MTAVSLLALTACGAPGPDAAPAASGRPTASTTPGVNEIVGTMVRFSSKATSVDVTIDQDTPAARDFLSMLPLTLTFEEFAGREKISYLPRKLDHGGSPGSHPEDGDLIYFIPWGNLGFYYNTAGIGHSDQTVHIGTYDAPLEQLKRLEGGDVTVEVVG
ncbi:cyclophilin-like fold protein [Nonomuraea jabiensis]|uniref:cyclophilin-like fold protein n=1 Tax=Nonomuraea jabiensis TaxID=882448 RepID=UPI00367FA31F